ncbi:PREDICTED: two pore calcium channel protein 1-like [Acropora digitifera]|uniref:two pore calcium channel protein 1-like n=1 Tax=Acropora digitifera TaxID=70779 RepID=UPI00077AF46C|nr:PREDICTED: two pore calcium channel protein 1-like [Acropora digitifera]
MDASPGQAFQREEDITRRQLIAYIYQDAAIYLQEGKNNDRFDTHPTHETIRWYRIVHSSFFYMLDLMVALLLLLLGLTEKPASEKEQEDDLLSLPVSVHGSVEVFLLSLVVLGLGFKLKWQGAKAFFMHKRTLLKVTVLVVMYVEAVTVLLRGQNHVRVTRALRPLFLIDTHYCYGVRRVLRQILLSLPPILDMLFLLFFIMTVFAMLGFYLFSGNEKDEYFTTFWRSFISLFVLLTTAKYHPNSISWQHFAGLMEFFKSSSLEEFYNVFETSEMKWKKVTEHYNQWYICLKSWKYLYKTVKGLQFINLSGIRWLITRKQFDFFIYAVIVLNGISFIVDIILFSNTPQSKRYIQIQELKWYHYIFIIVYIAEAFLKIVGFGLRKYFLSGWNVFDFMVTFFGVIGAISPTSFSYIVCIRPLRLLLLFKLKKRYRDVFETVVIVLPRMLRMALVIILLYYSFGIIGIECFSGLPLRNCCPNTSFGAEFEEGGYYYLNHFNDLLHSYVTLFELTVVNNWFIIMEGIVFVTSDWARIYFMSFYIVTMVVMTIIVAFVLEAFLFRMEYSKEHPDNEGEDMHIRKEITISYQELLSLNKKYVEDLQPNQTVKFIGKRPKTKMDLSLKMYKDGVEKWIQSERVVDPADSSAHVSNKEEAQSIPPTTIIANGSGVDMVAGTDGLSFKEMNATADENMESETRI